MSSLSGYPMEVNTQVNIGNHVGETNVGAQCYMNHNAIGEKLAYSNFITVPHSDSDDCAILKDDESWEEAFKFCRNYLALCPLCAVTGTKIFTMKGISSLESSDYNYYMILDEGNTISYFEGYRVTNIVPLANRLGWWTVAKDKTFRENSGNIWENITFL